MLADILARVELRLAALKKSPNQASKEAGLTEDAVRNMRRAVKEGREDAGVSTTTLIKLAPVLLTSPSWLLAGVGEEESFRTEMVGRAAANPEASILYATGDPTGYTVPGLPFAPEAVAVQVVGNSMGDIYPDTSILYFERQHTPPTAAMYGEIVVLETEDGHVLVKRLFPGDEPGTFNLRSEAGAVLNNQRLRWAASVINTIRPPRSRSVIQALNEEM